MTLLQNSQEKGHPRVLMIVVMAYPYLLRLCRM